MDCKESFELIIGRVAGRLDDGQAAALSEHISNCNNCRFELEATQWLARKLRGHNTRINAGHVSVYQLFKLVEEPDALGENDVEVIWEHLDTCDACLDDYDYLKDLIAVPPEKRRAFAQAIAESEQAGAARGEAAEGQGEDGPVEHGQTEHGRTTQDEGAGGHPVPAGADERGTPATTTSGGARARLHVSHGYATGSSGSDATDPAVSVAVEDSPTTETARAASGTSELTTGAGEPAAGTGEGAEAEAEAAPAPGRSAPRHTSGTETSRRRKAGTKAVPAPAGGHGSSAGGRGSRRAVSHREKSSGRLGPVRDFFAGIANAAARQPRNAAIAGAGIVIGLVVLFSMMNKAGVVGPSPVAEWETSEVFSTATPVQEVAISVLRRGKSRPVSTDLDLRRIGSIVVAIDLDQIDGLARTYDAVIADPDGNEIFRDEISTACFMDGRLLLRLSARHFKTGEYRFIIDSTDQGGIARVIARGTFNVKR
jgi:hypothetical protein